MTTKLAQKRAAKLNKKQDDDMVDLNDDVDMKETSDALQTAFVKLVFAKEAIGVPKEFTKVLKQALIGANKPVRTKLIVS